ncbi:anaerobic dimethyl sulfoxide reductase subunit C [Enterobacter cloacae]|uniref:Anaerobic dimethyl sulfoxide reductase subunit C n=1 Tax=Enterobacter cloacae TaxID=550 RepID=A0A377LV98_ENTCL|nr:anaerobic dimethyl sulfoxide reductase subunit C [Enterobacter cloacae]
MHELPLLIFTLFLQGSVGVTLWLALGDAQASPRNALLPAAGAFVLACLGLLASALHMGYPLNALNALRHVSSSWLSREIVFASLYLAALGLATLLMFAKKPGWKPLLAVAGLVGLVDVFCMAQIYIHTSVVTWQHINTLVLFIGSVGIIGSACVAVGAPSRINLRAAVVIITLLVLVRLVMKPVWLGRHYSHGQHRGDIPSRSVTDAGATAHGASAELVRFRCGHAVFCRGRSEGRARPGAAGQRITDCG